LAVHLASVPRRHRFFASLPCILLLISFCCSSLHCHLSRGHTVKYCDTFVALTHSCGPRWCPRFFGGRRLLASRSSHDILEHRFSTISASFLKSRLSDTWYERSRRRGYGSCGAVMIAAVPVQLGMSDIYGSVARRSVPPRQSIRLHERIMAGYLHSEPFLVATGLTIHPKKVLEHDQFLALSRTMA
jgi:hypothetical protein